MNWPWRRRDKRERIDPFTLTDPWRSFVQDAQSAKTRFERVTDRVEDGPLEERLREVEDRIADGVEACWRIAQSGFELQQTIRQVGPNTSDAVARMKAREDETEQKLAALIKNLDEAVARAAELATGQLDGLDELTDDVNGVVGDLEALRQALAEIGNG
jgi:hypothetical protein